MTAEISIRRGRRRDANGLLHLLVSLARFEKLPPPTPSARRRIVADIFVRRRVKLLLALRRGAPIGYALYFFTYSSFLAKPTLYLEDIFVLEKYRGFGVGKALLLRCVTEAARNGCGRMEWSVLSWNSKAIRFYERMGARRLDQWSVFRLDEKAIGRLNR